MVARFPSKRIVVVALVVVLAFTGLVIIVPNTQAATWTQDTDADFNAGTFSGTVVVGAGAPAVVQLVKDATDWVDEAPISSPGAREAPAVAYDSGNNVVVAFGGFDGAMQGDTWEYNPVGNTWTQTSTAGPSPRELAGMTYDPVNGVVVLFGGVSGSGFESDTWEYNAATNTWLETTPVFSPPAVGSYHLAFVASQQRVLLEGLSGVPQMETWSYDAALDFWTDLGPASQPDMRANFAMGYHAALDRVVLFGGAEAFTEYQDTWEYNWAGNAWSQTSTTGPSARTNAGMSYRGSTSNLFLFGGTASGVPQSDTWRYFDAGGSRQWVPYGTQRAPAPRDAFGFADETFNGKSVLYAGVLAGGMRASDTWALGPVYRTTGHFTSQTFDSGGASVNWNTLSWVPPSGQPAGTTLRFQIAASNAPAGPWTFLGPNCAGNTYYTVSGTATCVSLDNTRYLQVRAELLTADNLNTPQLDSFVVDYTVPAADPFILFTDPPNGPVPPVSQTAPIFIRFSEPMDTTSVSIDISPPISTTRTWSEGDSAVTLDHATPFPECRVHTVTVTAAKDKAGNNLVPGPVPNPWVFVTVCINPEITTTNPVQGQMDVPLNSNIVVTFSESMDPATVSWTIVPSYTLSPQWSGGNTILTLTHVGDFDQCEVHTVEVFGKDLAGLSLIPGPVPNPFAFTTVCTTPFIISTDPAHLQTNVGMSASVVVVFSEPLQPPTVTWSVSPSSPALTPAWSNGDRTLTLSHSTPWATCTMVTMQITGGKDLDGNDLFPGQHMSHAPNPWKFATVCASPFLRVTVPMEGDVNVSKTDDLFVQFSEPMNTASVSWTIVPDVPLIPTWVMGSNNQDLRLTPGAPLLCGVNTVTISGSDVDGNPLVPGLAPNPWSFTPQCPNPYITATDPANGTTGVPVTASIVVTFVEPINTTSLVWDIVPTILLTPGWSMGDTVLTLSHAAPFAPSTQYDVTILSAFDLDGYDLIPGPVPNPWTFRTAGVAPFIVSTIPVNNQVDVALDADVVVTFSEPMDRSTVGVTPTPAIALTFVWTDNNMTLTLTHPLFEECTRYTFQVAGRDLDGDPLVPGTVPNPWSFDTICVSPFIEDTNPADGAANVPLSAAIWVNFSEPMNTLTVTASIVPSAGGLSYSWSNGDQTLRITHATDFADCANYQVTVAGEDVDGNPLIGGPVPNPWTFRAVCAAPFIVSTIPADGATDVPTNLVVVVTFSRAMNTAAALTLISFVPTVANLMYTWSGGDTIMSVAHDAFSECTSYVATVTGQDTNGNFLVPGLVPNPWTFTTACPPVAAPGGLGVARIAPDIIRLSWNAVSGADQYRVYTSADRFTAWPWSTLGTTTGTTLDATGHLTDGLTHFYLVRALRALRESPNSTMASKVDRPFSFNLAGSNVHWFSLPYVSTYVRASDIAGELTNARIDVVAKWNPATQSPILYYWFRGAWRGTDFAISSGDGLFVGAVSTFSWVIVGTDRSAALSFTRNTPPVGNANWLSLPHTGTYRQARDIVLDIEGSLGGGANTKIVEVAKWDSATQGLIKYFWTAGGWTGDDFSLAPGDAVYVTVVSNFTWQPKLVTPEVP